jgi:hypothetical protein
MERQGLPPEFALTGRAQQPVPHLGSVDIRSRYADAYSAPLPAVMEPPTRPATVFTPSLSP